MRQTTFSVILVLTLSCSALAETLEEMAAAAVKSMEEEFASHGLDMLRQQLHAPGKSDAEKQAIIDAAVKELAECRVATSIEFAEEYSLSAETLLRWQAGWELTEVDRDTLTRMDDAAFRRKQAPCKEAFMDALPTKLG